MGWMRRYAAGGEAVAGPRWPGRQSRAPRTTTSNLGWAGDTADPTPTPPTSCPPARRRSGRKCAPTPHSTTTRPCAAKIVPQTRGISASSELPNWIGASGLRPKARLSPSSSEASLRESSSDVCSHLIWRQDSQAPPFGYAVNLRPRYRRVYREALAPTKVSRVADPNRRTCGSRNCRFGRMILAVRGIP